MSVFESLRVAESEPQFLGAHLSRLRDACRSRGFSCDESALAAAGNVLRSGGDGFARIYVTAGDGSVSESATNCRVFVFVEPRARPAQTAYDMAIHDEIAHPLFGGIKTANYWLNIDALQRAQRRGKNEALLFNERTELVSACMANVFLVHDSRVRTPSLQCGVRAGVIRERVMQQLEVEETSLFVADVMSATEIFLTNSWIGVMPVASVEGRPVPAREVATRLRDALPACHSERSGAESRNL